MAEQLRLMCVLAHPDDDRWAPAERWQSTPLRVLRPTW